MTKEEIIAAITAKIEGQGTNVDAGGGLAPILKAIIDLIPGEYDLPVASAETLGGVKVGENLSIDPQTGILSAQGGGALVVPFTRGIGDRIEVSSNYKPAMAEAFLRVGKPILLQDVSSSYLTLQVVYAINIGGANPSYYVIMPQSSTLEAIEFV